MYVSPPPQPINAIHPSPPVQSFVDSRNNGLDGVVPRSVLQQAKGYAIFTVAKAGFLFSARAGSGVVIARLDDGKWSAPSAIGTAGVGFGGQAGAEVTDFLVVLNTRAAIRSFMAAGSLTLGGNMSIALGPLGRNGEAIGSVSTGGKVAAMYSYSKTRGLFGGISVEGSVIVERQDANAQAYRSPVTVKMLLSGLIDPPEWAEPLIRTLESCTGMPGTRGWIHDEHSRGPEQGYYFSTPSPQPSPSSNNPSRTPSFLRRKKTKTQFPPPHWGATKDGGSYFSEDAPITPFDDQSTSAFETRFDNGLQQSSTFNHPKNPVAVHQTSGTLVDDLDDPFDNVHSQATASTQVSRRHTPRATSFGGDFTYSRTHGSAPVSRSHSVYGAPFEKGDFTSGSPFSDTQRRLSYFSSTTPEPQPSHPGERGVVHAVAQFDFKAVEDGDLSFKKGDVIAIIQKSDNTEDWWTGRIDNREGIFPANFVEVI